GGNFCPCWSSQARGPRHHTSLCSFGIEGSGGAGADGKTVSRDRCVRRACTKLDVAWRATLNFQPRCVPRFLPPVVSLGSRSASNWLRQSQIHQLKATTNKRQAR